MIDPQTKDILLEIQLDNIVKALSGTITHQTVVDHTGRSCKRIIIEYDEQHS